jgi:apolipoprotein N-acyltransferase
MLGPGRYLLGAAELIWLVGFAWLGASRVRRRLLPEVGGEAGFLATLVVAIALLLWIAELLGTVSLFKAVPYLVAVAALGLALRFLVATRPAASPPAGGAPMGAPRRAQAAEPPSTVG